MDAKDIVLAWIRSDPGAEMHAREIARGGEFLYGDDELHEWVNDILWGDGLLSSDNLSFSGHLMAARPGVQASMRRSEFRKIEWAYVRSELLSH